MNTRVCPECGAAFMMRRGNHVCCSDKCRTARQLRKRKEGYARCKRKPKADEREERARRRAEFFAARDAAFERAGLPIPKIEIRNGMRIENRGTIAWGGRTFPSNPSIPR
ncbi:MAG: hypothetical protein SOW92_00475 [Kiritimatiellia bacterium]|nr:hypothetical protein [Kiritimatiellia bacterium]